MLMLFPRYFCDGKVYIVYTLFRNTNFIEGEPGRLERNNRSNRPPNGAQGRQ